MKRLGNASEAHAEAVIRRVLSDTSWLVSVKTRLQDVLEHDPGELTDREFSMYRSAHFDYVIYHAEDHEPAFAIEFDGFRHDDPAHVERDVIKNRFCVLGGLPLLRIGMEVTQETEKVSVLEWLLGMFVEFDKTMEGIAEELSDEDDDSDDLPDLEDGAGASDYVFGEDGVPSETDHPFPANAVIAARLLRRFGISVERDVDAFKPPARTSPFVLEVGWVAQRPLRFEQGSASEFVISERQVKLRPRSAPGSALFDCVGHAHFAWALRTDPTRAPAGRTETKEEMDRRLVPVELDWLDPWGVASQLALYNALSRVEQWAERNLVALSATVN